MAHSHIVDDILVVNYYDKNITGKTYIVGDLHGCYHELFDALNQLNFDFSADILYSTGDIIDRGPHNYACLGLLNEPWFRPVIGNHEFMMVETLVGDPKRRQIFEHIWLSNGGRWKYNFSDSELFPVAEQLRDTIPYVISVGEENDPQRFYIVHAELTKIDISNNVHPEPHIVQDHDITNWMFTDRDISAMMWGRQIFQSPQLSTSLLGTPDLPLLYVGHPRPITPHKIEGQVYIDQGACYQYYPRGDLVLTPGLTIVDPYEKIFHIYNIASKTTTKYNFDQFINENESSIPNPHQS